VIVEVKSIDGLLPVHVSQVLTYLRFSERRLGYLVNFNTVRLKDGVRRVVL
jgi:GxxExxY protein